MRTEQSQRKSSRRPAAGAAPCEGGLAGVAPPHDEEAEASVLGAILLADRWLLPAIAGGLTPEDFYRPRNRAVFAAMLEINELGRAIDTVTCCSWLDQHGQLEEAGGRDYVETLVTRIPAIGNTKQYVRIVKENSVLRELVKFTWEVQESVASREGSPQVLVEQARRRVERIAAAAQLAARSENVRLTAGSSPAWSIEGRGTR